MMVVYGCSAPPLAANGWDIGTAEGARPAYLLRVHERLAPGRRPGPDPDDRGAGDPSTRELTSFPYGFSLSRDAMPCLS